MNFKNKTEIIRFSRCVVFPLVPPLSHFAARAGMRGTQRIWDSEGKKRREKGRNCNFCFIFEIHKCRSMNKNPIFIAHIELTKLYLLRLFPSS